MSQQIDRQIVQMEFRNQQFQQNAEKTMATMDKLEKSLHLDDSGISKSLDVVASKFTSMGTVATTVLANLTTDAYRMGKTMVNALAIQAPKEGFGQYEKVLTSTKVLMNATGESLESVNGYLDDMQKYAEDTVYDFAFMTENVKKLVNTGMDLSESVEMMKGLGNALAYAGVEGQQAYSVMYNVSQAMGTGYMGLIDWKSLELAGMATKKFKQVLIDTAVAEGTLVKVGEKYQSTTTDLQGNISELMDTETMRNTLNTRWLTDTVLKKAFAKYNDRTTELGKNASASASDITKFSKMIDALKESISGQWGTSFKIIFGDLNEATEMWTGIYNRIDTWLSNMGKNRNKVLQAWAGFGGRDELISAFHNVMTALETLTKPMTKALDLLYSYNKGWRYAADSMNTIDIGATGNVMYETLVKMSRALNTLTKNLIPSEQTIESLTYILLGLFTILRDLLTIITPIIGAGLKILKIVSPLLKVLLAIGGAIGKSINIVSNALRSMIDLSPAVNSFNDFLDDIYSRVNKWADKTVESIYKIPDSVSAALLSIKDVGFPDLSNVGKSLIEGLTNAVNEFKDKRTFAAFFDGFFNTESVKEAGEKIKKCTKSISSTVSQFTANLSVELESSGPAGAFLVDMFRTIQQVMGSVFSTAKSILSTIGDAFGKAGVKVSEFFDGFNMNKAIEIAQIASFIIVMLKLRKSLKSLSDIAVEARDTLKSLKIGIKSFAGAVKDIGKGVKMQLQAEAFKNIAFGLGVIMASIIAISLIDKDKLDNAVGVFIKISAMLAFLVLVISEFRNQTDKTSSDLAGAAKNISDSVKDAIKTISKAIANSIVISALATTAAALAALLGSITIMMVALSAINSDTLRERVEILKDIFSMIGKLVLEIGVIMAALVLIDKIPSKGKNSGSSILKSAIAIMALSRAVSALLLPIIVFSKMDTKGLTQGIIGVTAVMGILLVAFTTVAVMSKMSSYVSRDLMAATVALNGFALAITALIFPIFTLGLMDPKTLSNGLWALGHIVADLAVLLIALGVAVRIMGKESGSAIKLSMAFGILAASVAVFTMMAPNILNNIDDITSAMMAVIGAIVHTVNASVHNIVSCVLDLVDVLMDELEKYIPIFLEHVQTMLESILVWLEEYLPGFASKVVAIIGKTMRSLIASASQNVDLVDLAIVVGTVWGLIQAIKSISKLTDQIKEATPALLLLAGIVSIVGIVLIELIKVSSDIGSSIAAAVALKLAINAMVEMAKSMPEVQNAMKHIKFLTIERAIVVFAEFAFAVVGVFAAFSAMNLDAKMVAMYGAGLAAIFYAFPILMKSVSAAQTAAKKFKAKDIAALGIVIGEMASVMVLFGGMFTWMSHLGMSWDQVLSYSAAMSLVLLSATVMIRSLAVVGRESHRTPDNKALLKSLSQVAIICAAVGVTFGVIAGFQVEPLTMLGYAAAISLVFLALGPLMKAVGEASKNSSDTVFLRQFLGQMTVIGTIILGVGTVFAALHGLEVGPFKMIGYAASMSLVFVALSPMLKALGKMAKGAKDTIMFRQFAGIMTDVGGIVLAIGAVFWALDKLNVDPKGMVHRSLALSLVFVALNPMLKALGKTMKWASKLDSTQFGNFIGIFIDVGLIAAAIGGLFVLLDKLSIDPLKMSDYAVGLSIAFIGISPLILAVGYASKWSENIRNPSKMIGLVGMISVLALVISGALATLSALDVDPTSVMAYSKALSLAMVAMTPAILAMGLMMALFSKISVDPKTMFLAGIILVGVIDIALILITAIMAGLGAINDATNKGFNNTLLSGIEILNTVAQGLGSFVGTLIGSGIGSGLGGFATSAKPFFDAMNELPSDFAEKVGALADGLLKLSGAAFIEQLGLLFNLFSENKGSSLKKLGEDLNDFAPEIVELADELKSITPEQAETMKNAGEAIASIINAIPKEGGWIQNIFGTADMDGFVENLPKLAKGIVEFSLSSLLLDEEAVKKGVECCKVVVSLYNTLSENGVQKGILPFFSGIPDMDNFVKNLPLLGKGIVEFTKAVSAEGAINEAATGKAVNAAKMIAGVYDVLPLTGGITQWFTGFPDMKTFSDNIKPLGEGIASFSENTNGIKPTQVGYGVDALKKIAEMQTILTEDNTGWIFGTADDALKMDNFKKTVPKLGSALKEMSDNMAGTDIDRLQLATDALNAITDMTKLVEDLGGISVESFQKAIEGIDVDALSDKAEAVASDEHLSMMAGKFKAIGQGYIQNLYIGMSGEDTNSKNVFYDSVRAINTFIDDNLKMDPYDFNSSQWLAGRNISIGLANGMKDSISQIKVREASKAIVDYAFATIEKVADEHSPSKRAMTDGKYITEGLAIGLAQNVKMIRKPAEGVTNEAFNAMNEGISKVYELMHSGVDFQPVVAPVVDLTNAKKSVSEMNDLFSSDMAFGDAAIPVRAIRISRSIKMETPEPAKPTDLTKVTESIIRIGRKLSDMENKMDNLTVVMDSGELVGSITPKMIRSISKQEIKRRRGVTSVTSK